MSPMAISDPSPAPQTNGAPLKAAKAWQPIKMSSSVRKIGNPIRELMTGIDLGAAPEKGSQKPLLNLGLGDPTVFGNMPPHPAALDAIEASLRSGRADGYPESVGYADARQAVADYFDEGASGNWRITKRDVVMTHGASGALEMALAVLAEQGKNVLFPKPLFTAYETMIATVGAEIRYYDLLPEQNWEVDIASVERLVDENTTCIMLNNPSNPCGSNWSKAHLLDLAAMTKRNQLVVISDEVYAGMAWNVTGEQPTEQTHAQGKFNRGVFTPYASVCGDSPALIVGAVSKRWLAPGWRLGWVIVHDPQSLLDDVRDGLGRWAFRIQGPNSTMQRSLPALLANTPEAFFDETKATLSSVGQQLFARLAKIDGLKPLLPQGAMYLMCGGLENFDFENDRAFVTALHKEELVFILPGSCFRLDGFMRFVTTVPLPVLLDAADRIDAFCQRHRKTVA
ncbi:tyrosine aminotransferase [Leucosporidium creatinivorum]|uniref:Tyrosine aminotransferase n=1 Tax=Leucosporidium creatinivorum TaxID=106004 RepID=A0A1Y2G3J9_9BASI|nr:tyrosine aminotransferase [Leucosporidium creatinivorum]